MKVSIVIPAHNEAKRIGRTLESYSVFFDNLKKAGGIEYEIIAVLNGCTDNTLDVVKEKKMRFKRIRILNFKESGKGFAIKEGFKDSLRRKSDLIGFVDADMATPPKSFYSLIERVDSRDCVIASRGLKDSVVKTSLTRRLMNRGFNFLVRCCLFLPYKDTQCGAKIFKREVIKDVIGGLGFTKWAFDIDLLYRIKKAGFRIKEVPTVWEDRKGSKLDLIKTPIQMFASIIRLRTLHSPFRAIVSLYDKLPERAKINNW